jgi:methionyl-tRNA formyltransferase
VAALALERGLALLRPQKVGDEETVAALRELAPDLGVVVAYGQFIPRTVRELPGRGYLIDAHASLLPKFRGAAPIARAVLAGETRTGISVMRIDREMDAGPVALVRELEIGADETTGELELRLAALAAEAIADAADRVARGELEWTEQNADRATFAPKLDRDEARLDFDLPAAELALQVRGFAPRPGAHTMLGGEPLRILAAVASSEPVDRAAGRVQVLVSGHSDADDPPLRIATGDGWLVPLRLQRAGGKPLDVATFLRGRPVEDGSLLGEPA